MSGRIQGVQPREWNGKKYRSTLEAKIAQTLDCLGLPFSYETKKIILLEGFRCPYQKEKIRSITYMPDFIVGNILIEAKGFETPEWKNKKKYIFKYLMENEPDTPFYIIKSERQLLEVLDNHWAYLGYAIQVTPKPSKAPVQSGSAALYDSLTQAMSELHLMGKPITPILRSLKGEKDYVYNFNWKLIKQYD